MLHLKNSHKKTITSITATRRKRGIKSKFKKMNKFEIINNDNNSFQMNLR